MLDMKTKVKICIALIIFSALTVAVTIPYGSETASLIACGGIVGMITRTVIQDDELSKVDGKTRTVPAICALVPGLGHAYHRKLKPTAILLSLQILVIIWTGVSISTYHEFITGIVIATFGTLSLVIISVVSTEILSNETGFPLHPYNYGLSIRTQKDIMKGYSRYLIHCILALYLISMLMISMAYILYPPSHPEGQWITICAWSILLLLSIPTYRRIKMYDSTIPMSFNNV